MKGKLVLVVLGATAGAKIFFVDRSGIHLHQHEAIPWETPADGSMRWPMDWLRAFLANVLSLAAPGDVVGGVMWGADLALTVQANGTRLEAPLHYRGLKGLNLTETVYERMSKLEMYQRMGGPVIDIFMPPFQLVAYDMYNPGILEHVVSIEPVADWMSLQLGAVGNNAIMAQDFGLALESDGRAVCEQITGVRGLGDTFFRTVLPDDYSFTRSDGVIVVPFSHDTVFAELAAYTAGILANPTGTWFITATHLGDRLIDLTEAMMEANMAIEGHGASRSLVRNSLMCGHIYNMLREGLGLSFPDAGQQVKQIIERGRLTPFQREDWPEKDSDAVAMLRNLYGEDIEAMAGLILSAADFVYSDVIAVQGVLGTLPDEIVVVGGPSQNPGYLAALRRLGFKPVVPKFAADGAMLGSQAGSLDGGSL
jgi:sugar (pentulose or hexulose) kinase